MLLIHSAQSQGLNADNKPVVLNDVTIEQRLNEQVPLNLNFRDETGKAVRLGEYINDKPVILSLVYYECPMLCNLILNGLIKSLNALSFDIGDEFEIVTVSFDPAETPALAAEQKKGYLKQYGRDGAEQGWHFLTGNEKEIKELTQAVGFNYVYNPETDEYAHAGGIMVLTPKGKLSQYFYGIEYSTKDIRFALIESSANKIGSPVDQILLYCFHYDPTTGKYGVAIMNIVRLAGIVTLALLGGFMLIMFRRDRRKARNVVLEARNLSE